MIIDQHVDLVQVLESFKSLKPPIDHVLELLPRLQARYYSISSSPKVGRNKNSYEYTKNKERFVTQFKTIEVTGDLYLKKMLFYNNKN